MVLGRSTELAMSFSGCQTAFICSSIAGCEVARDAIVPNVRFGSNSEALATASFPTSLHPYGTSFASQNSFCSMIALLQIVAVRPTTVQTTLSSLQVYLVRQGWNKAFSTKLWFWPNLLTLFSSQSLTSKQSLNSLHVGLVAHYILAFVHLLSTHICSTPQFKPASSRFQQTLLSNLYVIRLSCIEEARVAADTKSRTTCLISHAIRFMLAGPSVHFLPSFLILFHGKS